MSDWQAFVQNEPWLDRKSLWVAKRDGKREGYVEYAVDFQFVKVGHHEDRIAAGARPPVFMIKRRKNFDMTLPN